MTEFFSLGVKEAVEVTRAAAKLFTSDRSYFVPGRALQKALHILFFKPFVKQQRIIRTTATA